MTATVRVDEPDAAVAASGLAASNAARSAALAGAVGLLALTVLLSLLVGARGISIGDVVKAFTDYTGSETDSIVRDSRLPRTVVGLIAGPALGLCGALIQSFTRNPLADPGILGVNAGASFAVTFAIGILGIGSAWAYVWFAMIGAGAVTVLVYAVASTGRDRATPAKLTLAGVAISAVLGGLTSAIIIKDRQALDVMRFWGVGALGPRQTDVVVVCAILIAAGSLLALSMARPLNALALGDDLAAALGVRISRMRILVVIAVTVLAGSAVALAGPIGFVGLMVPHAVRWFTGPDQRWILAFTLVVAPTLLIVADIVGRVLLPTGELRAGLVTALIGAPVLIILVRRNNVSGL